MTWRDRLQAGSFRGVAFEISESRSAFGRRNKVHEYPQRDTPWAEDLGRSANRWSVQCFVVGPDYDIARDALVTALRAKGPGTLIHPYLGTMQASVEGPAEVVDSTSSGGMATFTIQFVESGADQTPAATTDTQGAALTAAANVQTAATSSAASAINVTGAASWVQNATKALLGSASGAIGAALGAVGAATGAAFGFQQQLAALTSNGVALLATPSLVVSSIFATVGAVADLSTYAEDALTQLVGPTGVATGQTSGLIGWGSDLAPVAPTTPSLAIQAANQTALIQTVQAAAASAAVSVVSDMDFDSYDDAVAIRDPLADQLDTLATSIADTGNSALAASIDALRIAMILDVTTRGANLARLYEYMPSVTEPALVIAERLYGDGSMADDIIARNGIQNPLFVAGGVALEVLSAS